MRLISSAVEGHATVDEFYSYCGMRSVGVMIACDDDGLDRARIMWNGQRAFFLGVLDQGFWQGRTAHHARARSAVHTIRDVRNGRWLSGGLVHLTLRTSCACMYHYFADGIYAAPTDAALREDVLAVKAFGYNMVRHSNRAHIRVALFVCFWNASTFSLDCTGVHGY